MLGCAEHCQTWAGSPSRAESRLRLGLDLDKSQRALTVNLARTRPPGPQPESQCQAASQPEWFQLGRGVDNLKLSAGN
eukprot:3783829-Rhodomonas_salina.3